MSESYGVLLGGMRNMSVCGVYGGTIAWRVGSCKLFASLGLQFQAVAEAYTLSNSDEYLTKEFGFSSKILVCSARLTRSLQKVYLAAERPWCQDEVVPQLWW